jgi:putative addiction module component (TIGR02574 family)
MLAIANIWKPAGSYDRFSSMSRSPGALLSEALDLPVDERLKLASDLIASVDGAPDPDWDAAWLAELDRRMDEARRGGSAARMGRGQVSDPGAPGAPLKRRAVFLPQAREELAAAAEWYEERRPGLGVELVAEVDEVVAQLLEQPEAWPLWRLDRPYRKGVLARFPTSSSTR